MLKRLVTGIILAVVVSAGVVLLPIFYLKAVLISVVLVSSYECAHVVLPRGSGLACVPAILLSGAICSLILFGPRDFGVVTWALPACVILTCGFFLLRRLPLESALPQITGTLFTILYVGLMLSFLGLIRELQHGWQWLLLVLAATFAADTGAFFAGHFFGRLKLAPRISPGKTVEGVLGGLLLAMLVAFFFKFFIFQGMTRWDVLWLGAIAGIVGPLGDLAESLLKRSVGVKDSSHLLPGHGGFLDRLDALLFTAPAVYWYLTIIR